jgi:hypothetical protein
MESCGKLTILILWSWKLLIWILVLTVIIVLLLLILLLQINIAIKYWYQKESHFLTIQVTILKLRVIQRKINLQEQSREEDTKLGDIIREIKSNQDIEGFNELVTYIRKRLNQAKRAVLAFLNVLYIHQFKWKTYFGTGDASSTGIASGGIWMVKSTMLGFFYELVKFKCEPQLSVLPYFQQKGFRTEIECIVSFRLGKAIYTVMHVLRNSNVKKQAYT